MTKDTEGRSSGGRVGKGKKDTTGKFVGRGKNKKDLTDEREEKLLVKDDEKKGRGKA